MPPSTTASAGSIIEQVSSALAAAGDRIRGDKAARAAAILFGVAAVGLTTRWLLLPRDGPMTSDQLAFADPVVVDTPAGKKRVRRATPADAAGAADTLSYLALGDPMMVACAEAVRRRPGKGRARVPCAPHPLGRGDGAVRAHSAAFPARGAAGAGKDPILTSPPAPLFFRTPQGMTSAQRQQAMRWVQGAVLSVALPSQSGAICLQTERQEAVAIWLPKGASFAR